MGRPCCTWVPRHDRRRVGFRISRPGRHLARRCGGDELPQARLAYSGFSRARLRPVGIFGTGLGPNSVAHTRSHACVDARGRAGEFRIS